MNQGNKEMQSKKASRTKSEINWTINKFFIKSLILAQDERWRRA